MDYLVVGVVAFIASGLTLFSGFGLGTVLTPAFVLFFPVPVAIAAGAVVHLANNFFKLGLIGRHADRSVVLRFGLPAVAAAAAGASLLFVFAGLPPLATYSLGARTYEIGVLRFVIGVLIVVFAALELSPRFAVLSFPQRYLFAGGLLSGFFGGLSGNQGAFRSAFLIKAGLDKEAFVATGVACAVIVDLIRLPVYGLSFLASPHTGFDAAVTGPVVVATTCAFLGAYVGTRILRKVTLRFVQVVVALAMIAVGIGLAAGLI